MRSWVNGADSTPVVILGSLAEGSTVEDGEDERLDGVTVMWMVSG
jgi:hypothetical protein